MGLDVHSLQIRQPHAERSASKWVAGRTAPPDRRVSPARLLRTCLTAFALLLLLDGLARAQTTPDASVESSVRARHESFETALKNVADENRRLAEEIRELKEQLNLRSPDRNQPGSAQGTPVAYQDDPVGPYQEPSPPNPDAPLASSDLPEFQLRGRFNRFGVDYDNGFLLAPENEEETPFSLKINSQNVFRYDGFVRGATFWIDSAGNQNPIDNSNSFQIPRGRLIFSGKAFLPELRYLLNIDYNTVTSNPIGFRAYVLSYRFSRALELFVGQSKVPGTREWIESAFAPLEGPDRTMATTFFRPSLSQGIWITGEPVDDLFYHFMMSNGFNTLNLRPGQLDNRFCWSGSSWWEPWGRFGRGYADIEAHEDPVVRMGACYTFALGKGSQSSSDAVENAAIRLSDGTLITQPGAFAPGVTLQTYDISLAAVDLALKYRGFSLSTEWFLQNLTSLEGNGPLPISATQAYGGFLQGGYFVLPQKVELYGRTSIVTGHYGTGSEVAGGLNWFIIPGKSNLRFTFDAAWLDSSPADQNRTGLVAGQTGLLVRSQVTVVY